MRVMCPNALLNSADVNGCNVIHWAAYKGNMTALRVFHDLDLDLTVRSVDKQGMTPVHRAARGDQSSALQYLIKRGYSIDDVSNNNETALDMVRTAFDIFAPGRGLVVLLEMTVFVFCIRPLELTATMC